MGQLCFTCEGGLCEFAKEKETQEKEGKTPNPNHFSCNESGPYSSARLIVLDCS